MDAWNRGRIIYAYLIWVVFKATAAGGLSDDTNSLVEELVVEAGKNVTLNCPGVTEDSLVYMLEWRANGMQLLEWQANGMQHEHANRGTDVWTHQNRVSLSLKNYALQFHPVTAPDSAKYECLINNRSTPDAVIKLIVQDVPDPPERPLITSFTSKSVNLSWAPGANSHNNPILHYVIYTRVNEDGSWDAMKEIVTPTSATVYTIENLTPFTVYSFRVAAVNAMGRSKASQASYYIITLREIPEGKPLITSAYNTSSTSIYLAWKPPSRDTIHGEFLGYRIGYRPRDKTNMEMKDIYIRDPAVDNHSIHNLEIYTQYLVSLQVFNPEGHGPATTVSVMTDEGGKTEKISSISRIYHFPISTESSSR